MDKSRGECRARTSWPCLRAARGAQDFWACVETSVSIFVVLELDDRMLPMIRADVRQFIASFEKNDLLTHRVSRLSSGYGAGYTPRAE